MSVAGASVPSMFLRSAAQVAWVGKMTVSFPSADGGESIDRRPPGVEGLVVEDVARVVVRDTLQERDRLNVGAEAR